MIRPVRQLSSADSEVVSLFRKVADAISQGEVELERREAARQLQKYRHHAKPAEMHRQTDPQPPAGLRQILSDQSVGGVRLRQDRAASFVIRFAGLRQTLLSRGTMQQRDTKTIFEKSYMLAGPIGPEISKASAAAANDPSSTALTKTAMLVKRSIFETTG